MKLSKKIILGSKSPRRKEIMHQAGFEFEIRTKETEEYFPANIAVRQVPEYLAQLKASDLLNTLSADELLICADTIVLLDGKIYGKPIDYEDAVNMLSSLSNNTHEVISGVCIMTTTNSVTFSDTTKVTFSKLNKTDIENYIQTFMPYDKAGSYAIQEWIGLIGIEQIRGNYYNIVGLPIHKIIEALREYEI